jgi:tetratricopeptide (TPR) repeat protein
MAANPDPLSGRRLDSWKEIAAFFRRAERTVKRWETERGLPVHRVPGVGRSGVFAYSHELAEWLKGRSQELENDDSAPGETEQSKTAKSEVARVESEQGRGRPISDRARAAAWVLPLLFVAALVVFFSVGHPATRFKALASRHAPDAEAQDLYLKGRYYWNRRTPEDLNKAIDYFTQAIVKNPSDAQPYVGLADCYNLLREFGAMSPSEAYPRALSAAQRAVELDDSSAEAHNSLAFVTFWWLWHGKTAEREFQRAIELNPDLARAHHWYATYLLALHRHPEALNQIEQAQRLEPSSTAVLADKGYLLWKAGRREEGLTLLKQLQTTEPSLSSTHSYLGEIFWVQQEYPSALQEWRQAAELRHDEPGLTIAGAREQGYTRGGLRSLQEREMAVRKDLFNQGFGNAYDLALICAALGEKKEALNYLQMAFDRREADMLTQDPPIPALRDEPAFQQLSARIKESLSQ